MPHIIEQKRKGQLHYTVHDFNNFSPPNLKLFRASACLPKQWHHNNESVLFNYRKNDVGAQARIVESQEICSTFFLNRSHAIHSPHELRSYTLYTSLIVRDDGRFIPTRKRHNNQTRKARRRINNNEQECVAPLLDGTSAERIRPTVCHQKELQLNLAIDTVMLTLSFSYK